jgi:hypothetical protein
MLFSPPGHSSAARQRRARARRKCGEVVLRVLVHEHDLAQALLASGRLTEGQTLDPARVEQELSRLISDWSRRWLGVRHA